VALLVLIFDLTGSGVGVAGIVAFEILPILLLGPLVGLTVDRYPRRSLMMAADLARAILALLVALGGSVPVAYGVAFGLSAFTQLFNPAASSTLPDVVEADDLVEANAALWTVAVVAQTVLAPLAGLLVSSYGTGAAFCLNAASYLASAAILGGLRAGRSPAASTAFGWKAFGDGVQAVRADPLLARLGGVQVLAALSAGATSALLVVLAAEHLGVGASGFGLLLAAIGLGAALGPLLLRGLIRPSDRRWLFGPYLLRAAVDVILATVPSLVAALPALVLYGVGTSTGMVAYQSTLQQHVRGELRGRVFASYDVLWNAARLVSLGLGGALADLIGIQAVYLFGGVLLLLAFAVGWMAPLRQTKQRP
jgi:predicted MFS family arabinose efflux permease